MFSTLDPGMGVEGGAGFSVSVPLLVIIVIKRLGLFSSTQVRLQPAVFTRVAVGTGENFERDLSLDIRNLKSPR
jgi:hypothetical protein